MECEFMVLLKRDAYLEWKYNNEHVLANEYNIVQVV